MLALNIKGRRNMKTILSMFMVFSLLCGSFAVCPESKAAGNASKDEILQKKIIGKWYTKDKSSYVIASFEKGGIYRAWEYENEKKEKLLYTMKGEWQIKDHALYIYVPYSQVKPPPFGITFGMYTTIKEISEFTDNVIFYSDEDGYQKTYVRIKE
jgi:hypothetical protein